MACRDLCETRLASTMATRMRDLSANHGYAVLPLVENAECYHCCVRTVEAIKAGKAMHLKAEQQSLSSRSVR